MITTEQIDELAKLLCKHMGLNPYYIVNAGYADCMTSSEIDADPHMKNGKVPLSGHAVQRWQTFRPHAERAIVTEKAIAEMRAGL